MKSTFVSAYMINFDRYFILLLILSFIRQTSSAVIPPQNSASLYTANDKVVVLTNQNFSSTVYHSKTAWLIEFYASWCGHCQSYANTYREVAIDTWSWKTIVRIGAINCYAEENGPVCERHNIMAYPTLQLIAPESSFNTSDIKRLTASDAKGVERELIKELDALQRTDKIWPHFSPINRIPFKDLSSRVPSSVKLVLIIVEKRDDFIGRQIMLDFSKYSEQLAIFRTTTDGKLWHRFQSNITDIPALLVLFSNQTVVQINTKQITNDNIGGRNLFNYAIRSYIHEGKIIDNFDDHDLEEIIVSKNALKDAESAKKSAAKENEKYIDVPKNTTNQKINMVDLETALSYMLRREIPRVKEIQGETYDALIHWLHVLIKYFPGREPVMNYLKDLLSNVDKQSNGITGKRFRELAEMNTPNSYLPNNQIRYLYCVGSSSQYRGYPCAVWLLFHTLTVSQVQSESDRMQTMEIPSTMRKFIKYFFGCQHCSDNFMKETSDLNQIDSNNKDAAIIYLWRIHNHVNKRLHGDETEDPKHPKIQFPPPYLCSNCQSNNDFDIPTTLNFLLRYYSKDNFDFSSVEHFSLSPDKKENILPQHERKAPIDKYSMIEINNDLTHKPGFIRSITSTIQHFSIYLFICFLVIIFLARNRYCKGKRKRYTL